MEKKVITYYDYENHFIHETNVTHLSEEQLKIISKFYEITIADEKYITNYEKFINHLKE